MRNMLKTIDRMRPLCPVHRDKQVGKPCLACTIELKERQLQAYRKLALEFLQNADALFLSPDTYIKLENLVWAPDFKSSSGFPAYHDEKTAGAIATEMNNENWKNTINHTVFKVPNGWAVD